MGKHEKEKVGISTILNPVPVVMVSCAGKNPEEANQRPNIITVAWAGTVNSEPPMLSISVRKTRHSYGLICDTGEFVVNLVNKSLLKACDYCGIRSGADEDKFAACGLTPVKAEGMQYAYAVSEAPVSVSCKVEGITELGSHDMIIAKIEAVVCDKYLLDENERLCLDKAKLIAYNHGEYFQLGEKMGFFGYSAASKEIYEARMGHPRERDKYKNAREEGKQKKKGKKY